MGESARAAAVDMDRVTLDWLLGPDNPSVHLGASPGDVNVLRALRRAQTI
jgi:hypothetical protein